MISVYKDAVKDAVYPKKGVLTKRNRYMHVNGTVPMTAKEVKDLRKYLQLSQALFAQVLGVSKKTVEAWERDINPPSGSALRLMNILKKYPDILLEANVIEESLV
jgi:Predicted transcriptional regulator